MPTLLFSTFPRVATPLGLLAQGSRLRNPDVLGGVVTPLREYTQSQPLYVQRDCDKHTFESPPT